MSAIHDTAAMAADRHQLAEYLTLHGPTPGPVLRAALGWTPDRFWGAAHGSAGEWFMLTTRGWTVVAHGRKRHGTARASTRPGH